MNNFYKIYKIFIDTNLRIKNLQKLSDYIIFCMSNNTTKEKYKTADHHILPQSKTLPFKRYKNLNEHQWNKATLTHKNHYIAHKLLYEAIEHISISSAFCAMHNKDFNMDRLCEQDLSNEYNDAIIERTALYREWLKEKSSLDKTLSNAQIISKKSLITKNNRLYNGMSYHEYASQLVSGKNNIIYREGAFEKMRSTKINTIIDGKNMDTIGAERAASTMKNEIILEDGTITTIYEQNGKKLSKWLADEIILEDGTITTNALLRAKTIRKKLNKKSKKYILMSVFNDDLRIVLPAGDIRRISAALDKLRIEKYLGKSKYAKTALTKANKENLIGLYTIPTDEDAVHMELDELNEFIKNL